MQVPPGALLRVETYNLTTIPLSFCAAQQPT
jgi:hypothetical protein